MTSITPASIHQLSDGDLLAEVARAAASERALPREPARPELKAIAPERFKIQFKLRPMAEAARERLRPANQSLNARGGRLGRPPRRTVI